MIDLESYATNRHAAPRAFVKLGRKVFDIEASAIAALSASFNIVLSRGLGLSLPHLLYCKTPFFIAVKDLVVDPESVAEKFSLTHRGRVSSAVRAVCSRLESDDLKPVLFKSGLSLTKLT